MGVIMHLEILIEDSSGKRALESLVPAILGPIGAPHTWRIVDYKGVGHLPKGLKSGHDAAKRILLDRLPIVLRGYGRTPGIDGVVVVVDADRRDCEAFLADLEATRPVDRPMLPIVFRLAIEEIEAWYFGDRTALLGAYPKAKRAVLDRYVQDAICDTWEMLADAIHPGGHAAVKRGGFPAAGAAKHEWAGQVAPLMKPDRNASPSFHQFRQALIDLTAVPRAAGGGA